MHGRSLKKFRINFIEWSFCYSINLDGFPIVFIKTLFWLQSYSQIFICFHVCQAVLTRGRECGVERMMVTGGNLEESKKAIQLSKVADERTIQLGKVTWRQLL